MVTMQDMLISLTVVIVNYVYAYQTISYAFDKCNFI